MKYMEKSKRLKLQNLISYNIFQKGPLISKVTMAEIKKTCKYDDYFTAKLFEQKYV